MPWVKDDVEKHKKGLTDKQKETWVKVANSALQTCLDKGGSQEDCEASAIKQANAVAGNQKKERQDAHACECLECGETLETEEHCANVECPECGGEMRRKERPGKGRGMDKILELIEQLTRVVKRELGLGGNDWGAESSPVRNVERFVSSPRNRFGTHSSYKFKGNYEAAWRCHFSQVGGGATTAKAAGPIRGTVRRTEMIAAAMKPECELPGTDSIAARKGKKSPLDCSFPQKPSDYGLERWDEPEGDEDREGMKLSCSDLAVIKRAALAEIKRRAEDREEGGERGRATEEDEMDDDRFNPDWLYDIYAEEPPERAIGTYRLHEQFYALLRQEGDEWPRVVDIYLDDDGMYGLVASGGKLYRYPLGIVEDDLQITDERQQVMELHQPMTEERPITVHRQADGRARWTAVACTAILNRVGEIDSTTLFDNMIRRAEEGKYPYLTFWHQGEALEMGHADFLARDGVVYIASGLFSEDELGEGAARGIEADPEYWGTSNKFKPCGDPEMAEVAPSVRIPVYRDGEHIEISILPEHKAAAWFTSTGVGEEVTRMRKEIADALRKLLGDENAEKWIDRVDGINRQADEEGMITREDGDQPDPQDTPPADGKATVELDDKAVGAIIRALGESDEFAGIIKPLFEVVERLGSQVEELAKKLDEASAKSTEGMVQVRERLNTLERDEEEKWRERLEDLPSRHVTRVTYKPRVANDPANGGGRLPSLADVAESTLSKIPAYGRRQ